MNKAFFLLSFFTICIGITTVLVVLFWLVYPYNPIVFNDPVFPVRNKVVKAGGKLRYTSDYCKFTKLSAVISRTFVDGLIFITPPTLNSRPEGCNIVNVEVPVPDSLPSGTYRLENVYIYQVNPIRTITIKHDTEVFEVVGGE